MIQATTMRRSAWMYAQHPAVWCDGRELTYAQVFERACRLVNVLRSLGAVPGDRVAALGDNAFETVEHGAACALGNFVRSTLYTYHAPSVNRYLLELIDARVLLVQAKYAAGVLPLLADLPGLKAVIVYDGPAPAGTVAYDPALAAASAEDAQVPVRDDDVHIVRFSSGTTGRPKGIFHTGERWARYGSELRAVIPVMNERTRYLVPCSLSHLGIAFLWNVLAVGGCVVPMPSFEPRRTLDLLESQRITHAAAAPVMIREMLADPSCHGRDFSALTCLMYAGSPIASSTLKSAIGVFGNTLHQMYAQSEAMPITMLLPHQHVVEGSEAELKRLRSVGRPTPGIEVTVRDEDGQALPLGAIGEIAVKGGATMCGLWNDPEGTAARTLPDGSILTRDMGYLDADGFVYLVDRKDDMIVSGGFNIWPTELEDALASHPAVAEACVFGVPHPKWGETPKAVVVLKPGAAATAEALMAYTREQVGGTKKVTSIEFATALPRTATGKVQRNLLKAPYWAGHDSRIAGS
ncbi:MAG: AMP-binding protein [Burkholderiales bacterium]